MQADLVGGWIVKLSGGGGPSLHDPWKVAEAHVRCGWSRSGCMSLWSRYVLLSGDVSLEDPSNAE
ncbi:hypothetical protein K503DRAFT_805365 [Rhizopogon vinicolor AM-OR11-026]|uniref:Uncharacterized protein n=1 Tax=Rhizopogon vinicolor AM-OR11-026 TaxID=1314800 RepID=A0A1B7MI29_9AGAM|nr:hypothetical protein K503DRAFT_805365 [Rhizopogon vinicolor AM-OR11-026]